MIKRNALRLHNRDQVEVKTDTNQWEVGYVLGEPYIEGKLIMIPVVSPNNGYVVVNHLEVR